MNIYLLIQQRLNHESVVMNALPLRFADVILDDLDDREFYNGVQTTYLYFARKDEEDYFYYRLLLFKTHEDYNRVFNIFDLVSGPQLVYSFLFPPQEIIFFQISFVGFIIIKVPIPVMGNNEVFDMFTVPTPDNLQFRENQLIKPPVKEFLRGFNQLHLLGIRLRRHLQPWEIFYQNFYDPLIRVYIPLDSAEFLQLNDLTQLNIRSAATVVFSVFAAREFDGVLNAEVVQPVLNDLHGQNLITNIGFVFCRFLFEADSFEEALGHGFLQP